MNDVSMGSYGLLRDRMARNNTSRKDEINLHIGKRIRRRRIMTGYYLQEAADSVGVRMQTWSKWELGQTTIPAWQLVGICNTLNIQVSYLYEGL